MRPDQFTIRDFESVDAAAVDDLCCRAFKELSQHYSDWDQFKVFLKSASNVSELGEMIVAEYAESVVGVVTYVAPNRSKKDYFQQEWAVMRMLAVDPKVRNSGIGNQLIVECFQRAARDSAETFALHTTPLMKSALSLYLKHGFEYLKPGPSVHGVPYNIYTKEM